MMPYNKAILAILLMAGITFFTRAFPFILFGGKDSRPSAIVLYLGKYLPPAIICGILVYCFKDISLVAPNYPFAEILAVMAVVILQLWKKSTMISIFLGTAVYMILIQYVFI